MLIKKIVTAVVEEIDNQNAIESQDALENQESNDDKAQRAMSPSERKQYIKEVKAKKEAEQKARLKEEKEEKRRNNIEMRDSKEKKSKKPLFILIGLVVLAIAGYFLLNQLSKKSNIEVTPAKDTIASVDTTAQEVASEPETQSTFKLSTPCWIVSYGSFTNENYAKIHTDKLLKQGKQAGYYWIPDYDASGNKYFKVYIGPFETMAEAQKEQQSVLEANASAYPLYLK